MENTRPPYVNTVQENTWDVLVWVQPGAKKSELFGECDGKLKIRLAAPAVDNKANKALSAFVAKTLSLRAAKVSLVAGDMSRQKRLRITAEKEPDWNLLR